MSQEEERWEPVSRVVFKANSGMEQRIITGNEKDRTAVNTKAKVLQINPMRVVSLDLVESYDRLEETCKDCKKGQGYPTNSWWSYGVCCHECIERYTVANKVKRREENAQYNADAAAIRARHATVRSYSLVASEFAVSRSLVAQIVRGEAWSR